MSTRILLSIFLASFGVLPPVHCRNFFIGSKGPQDHLVFERQYSKTGIENCISASAYQFPEDGGQLPEGEEITYVEAIDMSYEKSGEFKLEGWLPARKIAFNMDPGASNRLKFYVRIYARSV